MDRDARTRLYTLAVDEAAKFAAALAARYGYGAAVEARIFEGFLDGFETRLNELDRAREGRREPEV